MQSDFVGVSPQCFHMKPLAHHCTTQSGCGRNHPTQNAVSAQRFIYVIPLTVASIIHALYVQDTEFFLIYRKNIN